MLVIQIHKLPQDLANLAANAKSEGFRFLARLDRDFRDGTNRFAKQGEALFEVRDQETLTGIGGLNIDPYAKNGRVGRVRRLYIHPEYRGNGVGKLLMSTIEQHAHCTFTELHLRTDTRAGALFYERLGYRRTTANPKTSHIKSLNG